MSRSLDVAVLEPVGGHGGMDYYDMSLCGSLVSCGVRPVLITCPETHVSTSSFQVWKYYAGVFGVAPFWIRGLRYIKASLKGLIRARFLGAKVLHLHFFNTGILELFNVLVSRVLGYRVVVTSHDVESFNRSFHERFIANLIYSLVSAVVAHNMVSKSELILRLGVQKSKINIIPHGNYLDSDFFVSSRDESCRVLGLDSSKFTILFFGQIKEVKGLDVLIRALSIAREKCGDRINLVIAGKVWKDDFMRYQSLLDELDLSDIVTLHIRYIKNSDLPHYYAAASVIVLPYRKIYQSGVLLMAMSFKVPVIVSNIAGMLEVVDDGVNGLVFESGNAADLAAKVVYCANNPDVLIKLKESAFSLMENKYGWSGVGVMTAQVYRNE